MLGQRNTANGNGNADQLVAVTALHLGLHLHLICNLDDAAQVEAGGRSGWHSNLVVEQLLAVPLDGVPLHRVDHQPLRGGIGHRRGLAVVGHQHHKGHQELLHRNVALVGDQHAERNGLARHESGLRKRQLEGQRIRGAGPAVVRLRGLTVGGNL